MGWKDGIIDWFDSLGTLGLGAISFTEGFITPVPPDLVLLPMLYAAEGDTTRIIWLWGVVTITSVLGGLVGYWIGKRWGRSLFDRYGGEKHIRRIEALTTRYGTIGIFIAAFSPIPYKVFGWAAGMGEMKLKPFILAGLCGRGLRFGIEALLIGVYGQKAIDGIYWLLDRELLIGVTMLAAIAATWFAWRWWSNLSIDPNIHE